MICPICKCEIRDGSKFCTKCGRKIPRCPACGKVFYQKVRFCTEDGTPIPEELFEGLVEVREKETAPPRQPEDRQRPLEADMPRNPKRPKKKRNVFFMLGILILVSAGGYLGYSMAGNMAELISKFSADDDKEDETEGTESETEQESGDETEEQTEEQAEESLALPSAEEILPETLPDTETQERVMPEASALAESERAAQESAAAALDPVEYFILNCDKMYFTKEDLLTFDAQMCRMARNGIYARLGRKFKDEVLNSYFTQFDWYMPRLSAEEFSETMLNQYQIANRDLIVAYEREKGY